jgi:hypothetical protein
VVKVNLIQEKNNIMGTKGTTVVPGVFKKMAGRAETKTGPLKKISAPLKKQNKSSYGGYNK